MRVIVDTCVWSLALRRARSRPSVHVEELATLINDGRVEMLGPIRQELLSGVRDPGEFERLRARLGAFPDLPIVTPDYVEAARCFNVCRAAGVQGSNTDFLICAVSVRAGCSMFTTDRDFERYAKHLPIKLHKPATGTP